MPAGPRLLLGGGLLPRLGQPRLGLLGAGLKPRPGLLGRRDLRFQPGPQPGRLPRGVLARLRHLLLAAPRTRSSSARTDSAASRASASRASACSARA